MAIQSTRVNTALALKYKTGVDASGNDILKTKRYSNVKVIVPAQITERSVTEFVVR